MDILRAIHGIEIYPVISLLIFVAVFTIVIVWAIRADGRRLDRLAEIPLNDDAAPATGELAAMSEGKSR